MALLKVIKKVYNKAQLQKLHNFADKADSYESAMKNLTDVELREMTNKLKERVSSGEKLENLLPEAFAVVREASDRVLGLKQYRVQLIAGAALHIGDIAEMKTGEGKTLVALAPAYLNALSGKGVHIITTNDYLATRDSEWMGRVFEFLGMSVSCITTSTPPERKRAAYNADITYGTSSEFGFDYLRDNMAVTTGGIFQRPYNFAIIDEVDSILIDEARIPLIISGKDSASSDLYARTDRFVRTLPEDAYEVNKKEKTVFLTDIGIQITEGYFKLENLSDPENLELNHHLRQGLYAHKMMRKDYEYIVQQGEVLCIDENTGRVATGRRYSNGLHQAIEIKEGLPVNDEQKTLATVTLQNYFKMYPKICGMTGTAMTEEDEFRNIYNLKVVEVPTNKPIERRDHDDVIYATELGKYRAIVSDIEGRLTNGQPVLVGTESIEVSEVISTYLRKSGIAHNVLNAKNHEQEAEIIAQAGMLGSITIATNMAGRGTDILLGGNPEFLAKAEFSKLDYPQEIIDAIVHHKEIFMVDLTSHKQIYAEMLDKYKQECENNKRRVLNAGGLYVLGVARHSSRRIDNQLRGRSGRQGDVGESRFYISMEDELLMIFGGERLQQLAVKLGIDDDTPLVMKTLSRSIESAQKKVEGIHYGARKSLLQYDDVMNLQRKVIYEERLKVLHATDLSEEAESMLIAAADRVALSGGIDQFECDFDALQAALDEYRLHNVVYDQNDFILEEFRATVKEAMLKIYRDKVSLIGADAEANSQFQNLQRNVLLKIVDINWGDHLATLDYLKTSVSVYGYFQQDPVAAYKNESSKMFDAMIEGIQNEFVQFLMDLLAPKKEKLNEEICVETLDDAC